MDLLLIEKSCMDCSTGEMVKTLGFSCANLNVPKPSTMKILIVQPAVQQRSGTQRDFKISLLRLGLGLGLRLGRLKLPPRLENCKNI